MKKPAKRASMAGAAAAAKIALEASGHAPLTSAARRADGDFILGGGSFIDLTDRKTQRFLLAAIDLPRDAAALVATPFLPHGVAIHPKTPHIVTTFEKIGPGCAEVDLATGEARRFVLPTKDRWFYGHGAYSTDGSLLYSTETINSTGKGMIGVRDARTFQYLGDFPTFGDNPHDCHLIEGGTVLVITNGGSKVPGEGDQPCVAYVEVESRKLLHRHDMVGDRFNTGHLCVAGKDGLVVVSAPRSGVMDKDLGAVSMRAGGGALVTVTEPRDITSRMIGEALSVEVHEPTGMAAVTHPFGDMVTWWSTATRGLVKVIDRPRPRGVTLSRDGTRYVLSFGPKTELVQIDAKTLEPTAGGAMADTFLSGSHVFNWTRITASLNAS
jgi:hypothetical protein